MKKFDFKSIVSLFLFCLFIFIESVSAQLKIMPLGDSITQGELQIFNSDPPEGYHTNQRLIGPRADGAQGILDSNGGYRIPLEQILIDVGWDVNMVGDRDLGGGYHEGYPGYMTSDIIPIMPDILNANNPDIVLLHIGTNDLPWPIDADSCFTNIQTIVDIIHDYNPNIHIMLAQIIPCLQNTDLGVQRYPGIIALNALLPQIAASRSYVSLVDMWTPFIEYDNWELELMSSTWHPNETGYDLMANVWAEELQNIVQGRSPQITYISPDSGFVVENDFQCMVQGDFFVDNIDVYLQHENGSRLNADVVTYQNTNHFFANFDLTQGVVAQYQVVAVNPNKMRTIHSPDIFLSILPDTTRLQPILALDQDSISFTNNNNIKYLQIENEGKGVLEWQIETDAYAPWITSVSPQSGSINAGDSAEITIEVDLFSNVVGVYRATLNVLSNVGDKQIMLKAVKTPSLPYSKRVICGSSSSFTDNQGNSWVPEQPFQEGSWGYLVGNVYETSDPITNTDDDYLYQTERWDSGLAYHFIVPEANYNIILHFAEIYHESSGMRQFSVEIEGETVLNELDIYSEAGHDVALVKPVNANVADGYLDIRFVSSIDAAKISAIEIHSASSDPVLAVSRQRLEFGTSINNGSFRIINAGFEALNWAVAENPDEAWMNIEGQHSGSLQQGEAYEIGVKINRAGLDDGNYSGNLHITSNAGEELIPVNMTVQNTTLEIAKHGLFEFALSSENSYQNPYKDVNLSAEFSGPNGETMHVEGYWFEENIWKIRFMPTSIGDWSFITTSDDASLSGISGRLECVASSRPGLLKVSDSNPYVFELNNKPFFWMGETSWLLMSNAVPFDGTFQQYISTRKAQHFNGIHFVLGTGGLPIGTDNPSNEGGNLWASQQEQKINPDFFKWMDERFEYLDDAEFVVGFFMTWAQHYVTFAREDFERFERYMIARYAAYPLVYWTIVGEFDEAGSISGYNYHGNVFAERDPYGHLITNHPGHSDPNNIGTSRIFAGEDWFSFLLQQYPAIPGEKTAAEINQYIIDDRQFNMPVVNIEFGYEDNNLHGRVLTTEENRKYAWAVVTGGGFFSYGNGKTIRDVDLSALYSDGAQQIVHLYNFMSKLPWWQMEPANQRVNNGFCLANGDQEFVIYLPEEDSVVVDLSLNSGFYLAQWYNPLDGTTIPGIAVAGGEYQTFHSPLDHDVVLHLKTTSESVITTVPEMLSFAVTDTITKPVIQHVTITDPIHQNLSWTAHEASDVSWLSLQNSSGSSEDQLTVSADTTGISFGEYSASIVIEAPNVANSPVEVPVKLSYTSAIPILAVNPQSLNFQAMDGGSNPANQLITIQNDGLGELNWSTSIKPDEGWLSVSDTAGVGEGQVTVSVDINQLSPGIYNSILRFSDPNSYNKFVEITATLTVEAVAQGPILAEFQAEESANLPNSGWEVIVNENESCLLAITSNISGPPDQYRLDYSFNVPDGVSTVFVFAEVDVNNSDRDDSFYIKMNGSDQCNWNGLSSLGDGWKRSWVFNYRRDNQHSFAVNPGNNTLSLYPREAGAQINWLVVTTEKDTDIQSYEIGDQQQPPESPVLAVSSSVLNFAASIGDANPPSQMITVNNSGIGSIQWGAAEQPDLAWLTLDKSTGGAGEQIQVAVDITGMAEGSYNGEIQITDPNASNSPVIIPVNLNIAGEVSGPILAEFDAEASFSLPNDGWDVIQNEGENCLIAAVSDISSPPEQYRLDYTFMVPQGVTSVYVFAEVDVNNSDRDDSFYIKMNGSDQCTWNGLSSLGDGWKRSWVYDFQKDKQHQFAISPGTNTLSLYPREQKGQINWLVVTTDKNYDIESFEFNDNTPPPTDPVIAVTPKSVAFSAVIGDSNPSAKLVTVNNTGAGSLFWSALEIPDQPWLHLADSIGTDGDQINVSVDIAGLAVGNYQASILISDTNATNGSISVPVQLAITEEVSGPVLAEVDAAQSSSLPNDGWNVTVNEGSECLVAIEDDINSPPEQYRLDYTFTAPPGVTKVYVFAEIDVNGSNRDDSFWIKMNGADICNWNGLYKLGDGWKRSWVYNLGNGNQHTFSVNAGTNTLSLFPREQRAYINWLVVTTDKNTNINEYDFDNNTPPPTEPILAVSPKSLSFSAIEGGNDPEPKKVTVSNSGVGTLDWTAEEVDDQHWLSLTDAAGQDGDDLIVNVESHDLLSGSYQATIKVSDPYSANQELLVQVTLTVACESDGPVLAEFEAESSANLPNHGWEILTNENELSLKSLTRAVSAPNEAHRLDYVFSVPDNVSDVFVFAEVDVNNSFNDDSFWVSMNDGDLCQWNNLKPLGDGWKRAWVYDFGADKQHRFSVQPGANRLSLYPRETNAHINWLVVTTDKTLDIRSYIFGQGLAKRSQDKETAENQHPIPERFNLYQNYPNPFNPSTMISFDLPFDARVNLSVFNVLGQNIETLVQENLPAGTHNYQWLAVDITGNPLPSGLYFYQIEVSKLTDTGFNTILIAKKMLLKK